MVQEKEMGDLMMAMVKDKKGVLKQLLIDFDTAQKNTAAFENLLERQKEGLEGLDPQKIALAYTKATKNLYEVQQRMLLLLFASVASGSAGSDMTLALNKMGRGQDPLQHMFQAKLRGEG